MDDKEKAILRAQAIEQMFQGIGVYGELCKKTNADIRDIIDKEILPELHVFSTTTMFFDAVNTRLEAIPTFVNDEYIDGEIPDLAELSQKLAWHVSELICSKFPECETNMGEKPKAQMLTDAVYEFLESWVFYNITTEKTNENEVD